MSDMPRTLAFSPQDAFLYELSPHEVFSMYRSEEVNGKRTLTIATSRRMEKETRILSQGLDGTWREWVVSQEDANHASGLSAVGTYVAEWSLQHDLSVTTVSRIPNGLPSVALEAALSGTSRWQVGTVTHTGTTASASMYRTSGWKALSTVVSVWGGEIEAAIELDIDGSVVTRKVNLLHEMGSGAVTRRFDYGADLVGIRRKVAQGSLPCRIIPLGKGEETETGGYGRRITIESANNGVEWLQNNETAMAVRLPAPNGTWEYPTVYVENDQIDDPQELKAWGLSVLESYTTPQVTYTADVMQLSQAGMDVHGVALGDPVQVVDRKFGGDGIRVQGRVTRLVTNELDESDVTVTIGSIAPGYVESGISGLNSAVTTLSQAVGAMEGAATLSSQYMERLLDRLNSEINATGGYTYITDGQGLRTYDKAVSDPLVGREASQVVEIKGGTIRIANSRTSAGDWDWKTVFTSGHITADMVTAAQISAGLIGDPNATNWNLDTGVLSMVQGNIYNYNKQGNMTAWLRSYTVGTSSAYADAFLSGDSFWIGKTDSSASNPWGFLGIQAQAAHGASTSAPVTSVNVYAYVADSSGSVSQLKIGEISNSKIYLSCRLPSGSTSSSITMTPTSIVAEVQGKGFRITSSGFSITN